MISSNIEFNLSCKMEKKIDSNQRNFVQTVTTFVLTAGGDEQSINQMCPFL